MNLYTFPDYGKQPTWFKYKDGDGEFSDYMYDIASVTLDTVARQASVKFVDSHDGAWYTRGYGSVSTSNAVKLTGLKMTDSTFEGGFVSKGRRGVLKGELYQGSMDDEYLRCQYKYLVPVNGERLRWHEVMMNPEKEIQNKINPALAKGDLCKLRVKISSVGLYKIISLNGGALEIEDCTQNWFIKYGLSGLSGSMGIGTPLAEGAYSKWATFYPKHMGANRWEGFSIKVSSVIGIGDALQIYDDRGRAVAEIPVEDLGSAFEGISAASVSYLKILGRVEYAKRR